MKKNINRIVAICLALVMCALLVPVQAEALTYNGSSSYKSGKYYTALTKVSLTGNQRTDIVNIAKSQVGYQEGSSSSQLAGTTYGGGNYTEYGKWYGMQDMWCAMFVSWCAHVAGVSSSVVPYHSYTPTGLNWFINKGRAYSRSTVASGGYTPQKGDIIYFKSARNSNITNHVGIVTSYSGSTVYTVEGNTSSATISTNGGAVAAKSYSISNTYIRYICKPAYSGTDISTGSGSSSSGSSSSSSSTSASDWIPSSIKNIVFDANYYYEQNADLKNTFGKDTARLYKHFNEFGVKEGRRGSAAFDIKTYASQNGDLKAAFGTDYKAAMNHFANFGLKENRVTAPAVDLGTGFKAKINLTNASLNLSLSGTNVISYTPSDAAAQIYTFERQSNGSYKLINSKTGQVLAVSGDSKTSGANVLIENSDNSNGQRWYIYEYSTGVYMLRPVCATGLVLSVASSSTASMANVQVDTHTGAAGQKFKITKVADVAGLEPVNVGDNFYAKIGSALVNKYLSLSNDNVVITSKSKASAQAWRFVKDSSNAYTIINEKTGKVLTSGAAEGDQVTTTADTGANSQKWYIYQKDGKYMIAPKSVSSCILDVYNDETADGTNIIIWKNKDDGSLNQLFTIEKGSFFDLVDPTDIGTGFIGKMTCSYTNLNWSLSGTNVIIYTPSDAAAQKYVFDRQSDGSYKLTNTKNNYVLTADGTSAGSNVSITGSTNSTNQRWFIYMKEGGYYFRAAGTKSCVIAVTGDLATATMTNVCLEDLSNTKDQKFLITNIGSSSGSSSSSGSTSSGSSSSGSTSTGGNAYATAYQMEVLRKIMYAVETGGQVYGNARYDDFTEAYTNTSEEHAITIGAGQWFATEAKKLLNTIRTQYPSVFASLDTAGIASDLDTKDWSTYKLSKTSAKAKCIQKIISSPEGIKCQDQLIDEQMEKYLAEAANLGVTEIKARMMCANLRHLGGLSAVKRILNKTKTPYTLDNIYAALQTDTGNQVGTFKSRNSKVYSWLVEYIG